jgi:hypothetical protein
VLKKVRTSGGWKLCPVVRESNGRLRDRVRVNGRTEIHGEGVFYIEWREDGHRRREAIPNPAAVLERARLKSLELEARKAGVSLDLVRDAEPRRSSLPSDGAENAAVIVATPWPNASAERLLLNGIEAYLKERVDAVLRARFSTVGATGGDEPELAFLPEPRMLAAPVAQENQEQSRIAEARGQTQSNDSSPSRENEITVTAAIDAYLKDVEPPQREFKTYEEYRNVLYRFRDNCKKKLVKEIDRKDCLEFIRHLYSIGN